MQELQLFEERLNELLPKLREVRQEALEMAGDEMLGAVRGRIGGSGRVQSWQEKYLGSGGGYTAVRAKAKTYDENGYAVGYATNALESGHKQQPGRYVPAIQRKLTQEQVPGRFMYARSAPDVERVARSAAQQVEQKMTRILEE